MWLSNTEMHYSENGLLMQTTDHIFSTALGEFYNYDEPETVFYIMTFCLMNLNEVKFGYVDHIQNLFLLLYPHPQHAVVAMVTCGNLFKTEGIAHVSISYHDNNIVVNNIELYYARNGLFCTKTNVSLVSSSKIFMYIIYKVTS